MGHQFTPIADGRPNKAKRSISRKRSPFNDLRNYRKWKDITGRIYERQNIVVSQLADNKREAYSYYHFIGNPNHPLLLVPVDDRATIPYHEVRRA